MLLISDEPEYKTIDCDVFGCHYDEGRITRVISPIESEQILAYRSMLDYVSLEQESGIKIFSEVGFAVVGEMGDPFIEDFATMTDKFCEKNNLTCEEINPDFVKQKWDKLVLPSKCYGRYSKKYNGYISVRNLVKACQDIFVKHGGERIVSAAKKVQESGHGFNIELCDGKEISAKKVVLTCGSFINFFDLVPCKRFIDYQLVGHTVIKFELSELDSKALIELPSMIYKFHREISDYVYILPPIKYPNGKTYIKLGHTVYPTEDSEHIGKHLETLDDVKNWYCQSDYPKGRKFLCSAFSKILPSITPISEDIDFCVMAITPSGKQYIDFVKNGLLLATGGNGKSAKFGLEIGRVCAKSIQKGSWDYDLDRAQFNVCYKGYK